jgi:hypothetical protein
MRTNKDTDRGSWDQVDCMLLVRDVSPKLIHDVYFICEHKETSIIKTRFRSCQHLRLSTDHLRSIIREFH